MITIELNEGVDEVTSHGLGAEQVRKFREIEQPSEYPRTLKLFGER